MYRINVLYCGALLLSVFCASAVAQELPNLPGPEEEHQWLQRFVGKWTTTSKGSMGPDQPPMECSGTIKSHMIGDLWVVNEMKSTVQGVPMQGVQTIGYDPTKEKYVGMWIDSMVNYLWQYEGTVDETGNKLTLVAEGPNFMADGQLTKFRDTYEFKTPDHIILTASMLGEDGKWITFMTGESKRTE